MTKKITVPLNEETKEFYKNMYLARKIDEWYQQYCAMWCVSRGISSTKKFKENDEQPVCRDEFITNELADKETMQSYLTYSQYVEYEKLFNEIFTVEEVK